MAMGVVCLGDLRVVCLGGFEGYDGYGYVMIILVTDFHSGCSSYDTIIMVT